MKFVSRVQSDLRLLAVLSVLFLTLFGHLELSFGQSLPPSTAGQWSADSPWPTVAVHLSVLDDGRLLTWGEDLPAPGQTAFPTYIVNIPSGSTDTSSVQKVIINDDIFCAGETFLPDGRLFVSGGGDNPQPSNGSGRATTDIFDPVTSTWISGPMMNNRRWYPTATLLPSGDVLNLLGSIDDTFKTNEIPDITTNHGLSFRSLTGVASSNLYYNYPRAFVAPNGKVFVAGMEQTTHYLDTSGTGAYTVGPISIFGNRIYGTAVTYDPGKILIAGGATNDDGATPTNTAEVIDLNAATPAWRNVGPMAYQRRYLNSTIMADGKILITGGTASLPNDDCTLAVLPAEIWDPATEEFTTVASMPHYRVYHSTTGLLPDGRVISAGTTVAHGTCGGVDLKDADFYSPPYLFAGTRPTIASAPATIGYGQQFSVSTGDASSVSAVNLISFGSSTHHFNFSQRINRLPFTRGSSSLAVTAPANANLCPPGKYMMFIVNTLGAASVAKVVTVEPPVTITAPAPGASVSGTTTITARINSPAVLINVYIDGHYLASGPPLSVSWNTTTFANGNHTISVIAYNSSSAQVGTDSITVIVANGSTPTPTSKTPTLTPTAAPTPAGAVKLTAPAQGATVSGNVTITAQVSAAVSWINVYIDGKYLASGPPLTFTWNSTTVANGAHTISTNAYGSASTVIGTDSLSVTVANGVGGTPTTTRTRTPTATPTPAGAVKLTAPAHGATVSGNVTITAQVSAAVSWINVYIDGKYLVSGPPLSFTWSSTTVANGAHTISTNAYGSAGTVIGTDSLSVTVANGGGTPTPTRTPTATPTPAGAVKLTTPAHGATVSGNVTITAQVSAAVNWINVYIDGKYLVSGPPLSFTWNSTTVVNGGHTISTNAYGSAGTVIGTDSLTVTVAN